MVLSDTDQARLDEIRERSSRLWATAALPKFDPATGHENPWVITSQADEDVRFLLTIVDDAPIEPPSSYLREE
jgi:hypothetical protein